MPKLYTKPSVLLHFNDDVLDSVNDIIPTGTTLVKSANMLCNVKNHLSVANKTFDISGKCIKIADSSVYDTTGDFTLKFAEYITAVGNQGSYIFSVSYGSVSTGILFGYYDSALSCRYLYVSSAGTSWDQINKYVLPTLILNSWTQWELDYNSLIKTLYLFKDGILVKSFILTACPYYNSTYASINNYTTTNYSGMIADFDFIKGTCSHTENFEPNQISSTIINKIFSPYLSDITYKNGRSLYLDGSSYLSFPNFTLDTSKDFTLSINTYLISAPTDSAIFTFNCTADTASGAILLCDNHDGTNLCIYCASTPNVTWNLIQQYTICTVASVLNKWVNWEIDYVDSTKTLYLFKDGILVNSWILTTRLYAVNSGTNYVGRWRTNQTGYYDEFLILQGKCLHTSNFTISDNEYVYIPYVINKIMNPYRLYGSVNKSTITLNVAHDSVATSYALYVGVNNVSALSYDTIRTINSNILTVGTNIISVQVEDGTIIGELNIVVEEIYRETSTRSFNDFDGGYSKSEVIVNTPVVNETITGVIDINNNYSSKIDKFIAKIQNT